MPDSPEVKRLRQALIRARAELVAIDKKAQEAMLHRRRVLQQIDAALAGDGGQ